MKTVSNDFKTQVNSFGRQLDVLITYGLTTLTKDNIYGINPNFHTNIMETLMKCMIVETDTLIPVGTRINVQAGVKIGNNYEYVNYGYYTVKEYEKEENKKSYKMKCYDDMMLTMVDYDLTVTYPITVKNLLTAICTHFDFTLDTTTFVNDDTEITTDVFSGINMTYRDALSELAIATCSTIEIENGVMYLKYPNSTNVVIDEDILNDENVIISKKYGPVNSLVLSRINGSDNIVRKDDTSIANNGLTELKINDKQIFSTTDRDNFIGEMFTYLNGFQYYIYDINTQGLIYLEALDQFSISVDNVVYPTILLEDETEISDGLNEEMFVNEPEITESDYKYTSPSDKGMKEAYILIDKQNAKITSTTSEIKTLDTIINGTETYVITTDETFQEDKPYYKLVDDDYILLIEGTDYNDGDLISSVGYDVYDVIYVDSITDTMNNTIQNQIDSAMQTIQSTILEQTSDKFTMWFEKTGVGKDLEDLKSAVGLNTGDIKDIKSYIEYGTMPVGSGYDGSPYILLGKTGSQTTIRILNERIQFLTDGEETAYISNNTLYINESTVLTTQTIGNTHGKWITKVDDNGNLNTYWGG